MNFKVNLNFLEKDLNNLIIHIAFNIIIKSQFERYLKLRQAVLKKLYRELLKT